MWAVLIKSYNVQEHLVKGKGMFKEQQKNTEATNSVGLLKSKYRLLWIQILRKRKAQESNCYSIEYTEESAESKWIQLTWTLWAWVKKHKPRVKTTSRTIVKAKRTLCQDNRKPSSPVQVQVSKAKTRQVIHKVKCKSLLVICNYVVIYESYNRKWNHSKCKSTLMQVVQHTSKDDTGCMDISTQ